jgi:hypothetical protein
MIPQKTTELQPHMTPQKTPLCAGTPISMVYVKLASEIQLLKFQLNFSEISAADSELLEICKLEVRVVTL